MTNFTKMLEERIFGDEHAEGETRPLQHKLTSVNIKSELTVLSLAVKAKLSLYLNI
jgi:hypothetical protein